MVWWRGWSRLGQAAASFAFALGFLAVVSWAPAGAGPVSAGTLFGAVTTTTGVPLGGISVEVYDASSGALVATATTGSVAGWYAVKVAPGSYVLRVGQSAPGSASVAVQWWPGVAARERATSVSVRAGQVTYASLHLPPAVDLQGSVFVPGHAPDGAGALGALPTVMVYVLDATHPYVVASGPATYNWANAYAWFDFSRLPPGSYKVLVLALPESTATGVSLANHPVFLGPGAQDPIGGPITSLAPLYAAYATAPVVTVWAGPGSFYLRGNLPTAACDPAVIHPGADLTAHDFSGVLDSCDFSGTNLTGADFTAASVPNAVYNGANLTDTTFAGVDLGIADFTAATLRRTDLRHTSGRMILTGTAFDAANLNAATLGAYEYGLPTTWVNTTCPDGTNSDAAGHVCDANHGLAIGVGVPIG